MARAAIIKNLNLGGIADSDYQAKPNTVSEMVGLDIHSTPGLIKVNQKLTQDDGGVITEFCKVAIACSDGNTYWFSNTTGKIWRRTAAGLWSLIYTTVANSGAVICLGAKEYEGYIYWATQDRIHRIQIGADWATKVELNWAELNLDHEEQGGTADGYLIKNAISEEIYGFQSHNYGTTVSSSIACGEANATGKKNQLAQIITTYGETMSSFSFYKDTDTGTFTGTVTFAIRNVVLTTGVYYPIGTDLISLTITNEQWKKLPVGWNKIDLTYLFSPIVTMPEVTQTIPPGTYTDQDLTFADPANVNRYIPQVFAFVVYTSTADNSNGIKIGYHDDGGATHGNLMIYNVTDGWVRSNQESASPAEGGTPLYDAMDLIIDYNRLNINRSIFTAHEATQYAIGVNIKVVGVAPIASWVFTIHDSNNNVMATKTVAIADLVVGWNSIVWTAPWTAEIGKEYHLHIITST